MKNITKHHFIFFAPQLAPYDSSAAGVRCRSIYDEFVSQNFSVEIWSPAVGNLKDATKLFTKLASNKSSLAVRLAKEIILACELAARFFKLKIFGVKTDQKIKVTKPQAVVLFSSPPYVTCLIAAFICDLLRIRYILDIRDPYPEVYFNQKIFSKNSFLGKLQIALVRKFYTQAEQIFTVTSGCKKIIQSYVHAKPVHLVRNGFDSRAFNGLQVKKLEVFTCIFHGNLGLMQNVELLKTIVEKISAKKSTATAATHTPKINFIVVGSGPKESLLRTIQTSNFQFLGEVKHEQIPALLASCHVGLSFRPEDEYSEIAFPVKIYEYIGAELPIIATPKSKGLSEIEELKMGFLFHNNEADLIADKIIQLARDYSENANNEYTQTVKQIQLHKTKFSRDGAAIFLRKPHLS